MNLRRQVILFLIIGAFNTLAGYLFYALFIFWGFDYSLALLLATLLGVLINFKTTGKIVFQNKNNSLLFKFSAVYTLSYFTNIGLIKVLQSLTNDFYLAGLLAIVPTAILTFILNKLYVFKDFHEVN